MPFCWKWTKTLIPRLVVALAALFSLIVPVGSPSSAPLPKPPPTHPWSLQRQNSSVFFCVRLFCSRLCKKLLPRLVMAFAALFPLVVPVGSPPSAPLPNLLPCPPDHFNANTQHNFFLHKKLLKIVQKNSSKIGCGTSSTVSPGCASWQLGFHPLLHCQTCSYSPFLCQCKNSLHISCTRLFCWKSTKNLLHRFVVALAVLFSLAAPVGSPPCAPLPNLLPPTLCWNCVTAIHDKH